jgi:hypothetical protein
MLATLNLQLFTPDLGGESAPLQGLSPEGGATEFGGFAELLHLRVDNLEQQADLDGQFLPPNGNKLPLPEPDVEILVNDQLVPDAALTPDVNALRAPDLGSAAGAEGLSGANLPKIEVPAGDEPQVLTTIPPVVIPGPVTPAVPGVDAASVEESATGRAAEQLRDALPTPRDLPRGEISAQQIEARAAGTSERPVVMVPPGPVADRQQLTPRHIAEAAMTDDDINRALETTPRQAPAPVAAPVVERLAEMMRSRVRPGQSVTAATAHAQPAGFQPLSTGSALSETNFASTLQQQATDLIRTPVSEPAWGDRLGERVVMLAGNQLKSAEIRLTPADLGPVRVRVSVEEGAANVTFQAAHAVTRDALEQALPRLREMLAENGLTLGQADVGDQGIAQGNRDGDSESSAAGFDSDDVSELMGETGAEERRETPASNGLVDTFA